MKINPNAGLLFERLQEVYELERGQVLEVKTDAEPVASPSAPQKIETPVDPTAARLETIAARALKGEFEDVRTLQTSVIEVVMEEKLKTANTSVRDQVVELLCDDPEFTRHIENMLTIAVKDIARRGA
jgi:TusA-related sulfurtransferase